MTHSTEYLRRQAKRLRQQIEAGDADALKRVRVYVSTDKPTLKHADYLHVITNKTGFCSWPKLKFAAAQAQMDQVQKANRLEQALNHGQTWIVEALLADTPDLKNANFGIECALYDSEVIERQLAADPDIATRKIGMLTPILHLAFSKRLQRYGDEAAMIEVATQLQGCGANIGDTYAIDGDDASQLSTLYGALDMQVIALGPMVVGSWC